MTDCLSTGKLGEDAVAKYLVKQGYFVVTRNYHATQGHHEEIDIIACNGRYLAFVEVKTRKKGTALPAPFSVNEKKQRRLFDCAQLFLLAHTSYSCYQPRFDVACVTVQDGAVDQIDYYQNAF